MEEDDDPIISCPFDSAHRHLRSRMPYHIIKCSKNDPRKHLFVNKRQCDFNATHVVDKEDYEKHLEECEDAKRILRSSRNVDDADEASSSILPVNNNTKASSDSNANEWGTGEWDSGADFVSYNPQQVNESRAIPQNRIGLSKAQKIQHRNQQRRRINQLDEDVQGSSNSRRKS